MTALAAMEPDAELMLRVRDGDMSSFPLLLERHRSPVIHYLYRMVLHEGVAEELAQEVFLRVFRWRQSYQPTAKFTTWLFRIATHLALNWIRDRKGERGQESLDDQICEGASRQVADGRPSAEQRLVDAVLRREIQAAIQRLPEKQRAAVVMHKYHEMDYAQISAVLGCSESATKSLLFRAYETLRARLAQLA